MCFNLSYHKHVQPARPKTTTAYKAGFEERTTDFGDGKRACESEFTGSVAKRLYSLNDNGEMPSASASLSKCLQKHKPTPVLLCRSYWLSCARTKYLKTCGLADVFIQTHVSSVLGVR